MTEKRLTRKDLRRGDRVLARVNGIWREATVYGVSSRGEQYLAEVTLDGDPVPHFKRAMNLRRIGGDS